MTKPSNLIMGSDYASMKNDPVTATASLVFPASVVIASGAYYTVTKDVTIGTTGSVTKVFIEHPLIPGNWSTSGLLNVILQSVAPVGGDYYMQIYGTRINATTVRLTAYVGNNLAPAASLTTEAVPRTINFKIYTFFPPFA